jgi:OOP family OmpA-OmpF porin
MEFKKMKTSLKTVFVAAALLAGSAGAASAQDAGWYVRGDLGGAFQGEVDGTPKLKADNGFAGAVGGGYALGNGIRAEGELLYLKSDLKGIAGGDAKTLGGFANVYYDFNRSGTFQPFIGGGLGFAQVKVDSRTVDDDDTGFAYQAKAGVAYKINDRWTGEVAYRYLGVTDVTLGSGINKVDGDFNSQAVTVGVRYKIGG